MLRSRRWKLASVPIALVAASVGLAACGSSGGTSSSGSTSGSATSGGNFDAAALARAKAAIAPYTGHPSAFPVTDPLTKKLPKGAVIDFMDCGTPVCALFRQLVTPAAKAMGVQLKVIKAGATADSVNAAFNSVAQQKPAAVINTALDPIEWQQALQKLKAEKIPIATTGVVDGAKYGLTTYPNSVLFGYDVSDLSGKLQADWVYVHYGNKANVQFNWVPELSFSAVIRDGFVKELKSLCPDCKVHLLKIPVATLGNKAPQLIVSDLQANPDTNVVVGSNSEQLIGLPAALGTAGLKVGTLGGASSPVNLQYIKNGQQTADIALDLPVLSWSLLDAAVRGATGQPITGLEAKGLPPEQFLAKEDITFDPSKGWTGYPDFAQRFVKLWSAAK
jgi:ribose transport system substrate-binding protein